MPLKKKKHKQTKRNKNCLYLWKICKRTNKSRILLLFCEIKFYVSRLTKNFWCRQMEDRHQLRRHCWMLFLIPQAECSIICLIKSSKIVANSREFVEMYVILVDKATKRVGCWVYGTKKTNKVISSKIF